MITEKQRQALNKGRHKFTSDNQPKDKGRKKSQLKDFVKTCNVSSSDVTKVFQNLILGSTVDELKELVKPANQGSQPVLVILCVKAFLKDMKNGTLKESNTVIDRILGKPIQQLTIENAVSEIPEDPEERQKLVEDLQKELGVFREDVSKEE